MISAQLIVYTAHNALLADTSSATQSTSGLNYFILHELWSSNQVTTWCDIESIQNTLADTCSKTCWISLLAPLKILSFSLANRWSWKRLTNQKSHSCSLRPFWQVHTDIKGVKLSALCYSNVWVICSILALGGGRIEKMCRVRHFIW